MLHKVDNNHNFIFWCIGIESVVCRLKFYFFDIIYIFFTRSFAGAERGILNMMGKKFVVICACNENKNYEGYWYKKLNLWDFETKNNNKSTFFKNKLGKVSY